MSSDDYERVAASFEDRAAIMERCLHCGGTAGLVSALVIEGHWWAYIDCDGCPVKVDTSGHATRQEAIEVATEAWNRRTLRDEEGLLRDLERICFRWLNGSTKEWPLVPALMAAVKERCR